MDWTKVNLLLLILLTSGTVSYSKQVTQYSAQVIESAIQDTSSSTSGEQVFTNQLELGLLFQKSYHFYWENGITATYRASYLADNRLGIGVNLLTSRLGSALGTNAIKQDQISIFLQYNFLQSKIIKPYVQVNVGYLKADYEETYFQFLDDQSLLTSINFGVTGTIKEKLILKGSLGYNFIGGDGQSGLATIYPLIFHLSAQYKLNL
ncbi:MAG: hypothetical protein ACJA0Q_000036 [Saprospiraceae bacterium]|jgi:hypothetical protein